MKDIGIVKQSDYSSSVNKILSVLCYLIIFITHVDLFKFSRNSSSLCYSFNQSETETGIKYIKLKYYVKITDEKMLRRVYKSYN